MQHDIATLAYMAGIIDGEGCIGINRRDHPNGSTYYRMHVRVTNTDRRLLDWIAERWGGSVSGPLRNDYGNASGRCRAVYQWQVSGDRAAAMLLGVRPFLVLKASQALLAVEFQSTVLVNAPGVVRDRVTPELLDHRARLWESMRNLNRKGK